VPPNNPASRPAFCWPAPNLTLLNNVLQQTDWRGALHDHLVEIPWKRVLADVEPFLLSLQESSLLTRENLDRLLGRK
jgi:hypothetical protein